MTILDDGYDELRQKFKKVDTKNPKSLYKWFKEHPYLNTQDHALIMGKCSRDVRTLRKFAGIKMQGPKTKNRAIPRIVHIAELPENWNTKEWLDENLPIYGSNAIRKASKCSRRAFYGTLRKLGVKLPGYINKNPCYSMAWCHRHYVELGYSVRKCARLAGVTHPTFADWLIKFKIQIRVHPEPIAVPVNVKFLIIKLRERPEVYDLKVNRTHLRVRFTDYLTSRYFYKAIPGDQWDINNVPKIFPEYEPDFNTGESYPAHITISNKALKASTIFERDLALHEFVRQITNRGWIWPLYPASVLQDELRILKSIKDSTFIKSGQFYSIYGQKATRKILLHYFDSSYIWKHFKKPRCVWRLAKALRKKDLKFNTYGIIRTMTRRRAFFRLPNIGLYIALFRRMGITGKILDLHLGTGARAVACGIVGCEYRIHLNSRFHQAINLGLDTFLDMKHAYYDGSEIVDLVISDNDLSPSDMEYALSFADRAKQIMVYVLRENKEEYQKLYKPRSMIKVVTHPMNQDPNFFFIW